MIYRCAKHKFIHVAVVGLFLIVLQEGIINFEKRRKEFELLAQLRLWQVSCRSYHHLKLDSQFSSWFNSVTLPTDEQA